MYYGIYFCIKIDDFIINNVINYNIEIFYNTFDNVYLIFIFFIYCIILFVIVEGIVIFILDIKRGYYWLKFLDYLFLFELFKILFFKYVSI